MIPLRSLFYSRGMRKLNNVNLTVQTSGSKQEIFDSVCEQRIKTFRRSVA